MQLRGEFHVAIDSNARRERHARALFSRFAAPRIGLLGMPGGGSGLLVAGHVGPGARRRLGLLRGEDVEEGQRRAARGTTWGGGGRTGAAGQGEQPERTARPVFVADPARTE